MTLAVARVVGDQIAVAADTLVSAHGSALPLRQGSVKICLLPDNICVAFANSPENAQKIFEVYARRYPEGTSFAEVVAYFEEASKDGGNDFLVLFGANKRIVKIVEGKRRSGLSKTQWIGDIAAWERFQEIQHKQRKRYFDGSAVSIAMFADEPSGSPASELFTVLSSVVHDSDVKSVGGFVTVASCRGPSFRYSLYSELLYDWPTSKSDDYYVWLDEKIHLSSTGENENFSVSQISPLYMEANYVAYYISSGNVLYLFHGESNGLPCKVTVVSDVSPDRIAVVLREILDIDLEWMVWVLAPTQGSNERPDIDDANPKAGISLAIMTLANTCKNDAATGIFRVLN